MSPHAILPTTAVLLEEEDILRTFQVSNNAFLPSKTPLTHLSHPSYEPWEVIIAQAPQLLRTRTLRDQVLRLPTVSVDHLRSELEWRRAYSILAFLAHAYIWGGDSPEEILPPAISVPLLAASRRLELPPVATYAALNLWNYDVTSSGAAPSDLDALTAQFTFTGTESESWFYMVSVSMEALGGPVIPTVLRAMKAIHVHDYAAITCAFESITTCIRRLKATLERMHERCDPDVFYHDIRPFLAGSKNMGGAGLPRGVFYDEGDGRGEWRQLRGGSNGQSSLIQFLDVVLGVEHAADNRHSSPHAPAPGEKQTPSFHEEVRAYMPGPHSRFLQAVSRMGSLRNFALQEGGAGDEQQRRCGEAYRTAVDAMTELRNAHLGIVTRYIVLPSRRPNPSKVQNLAGVSSSISQDAHGNAANKLTGTGGTALMPFLKKARDETMAAVLTDH